MSEIEISLVNCGSTCHGPAHLGRTLASGSRLVDTDDLERVLSLVVHLVHHEVHIVLPDALVDDRLDLLLVQANLQAVTNQLLLSLLDIDVELLVCCRPGRERSHALCLL